MYVVPSHTKKYSFMTANSKSRTFDIHGKLYDKYDPCYVVPCR